MGTTSSTPDVTGAARTELEREDPRSPCRTKVSPLTVFEGRRRLRDGDRGGLGPRLPRPAFWLKD